MTRLNSKQRRRLYPHVERREIPLNLPLMNVGPYCRGCGKMVSKDGVEHRQGILDCIDNSGDHTRLDNLQLLCKPCNALKNPRGPKPNPNRENLSWEASTNIKGKKKFRAWAIQLMLDHNNYPVDDMIAAGAEFCDLETITTSRYLRRMASTLGPFEIVADRVFWRSDVEVDKALENNSELVEEIPPQRERESEPGV